MTVTERQWHKDKHKYGWELDQVPRWRTYTPVRKFRAFKRRVAIMRSYKIKGDALSLTRKKQEWLIYGISRGYEPVY